MDEEKAKKPSALALAREEARKALQTGDVARMVATYLLLGKQPDLDVITHGVRVRAFGLHRADGGYITVLHLGDGESPTPVIEYAEPWCHAWDRFSPSCFTSEVNLRGIAMRDTIVPEIRRITRELVDSGKRGL